MRYRGPRCTPLGRRRNRCFRSQFIEAPLLQGAAVDVRVDDAQYFARAVVALRVLAPNAIRPIVGFGALLLYARGEGLVRDDSDTSVWNRGRGTRGAVQRAGLARRRRGRRA